MRRVIQYTCRVCRRRFHVLYSSASPEPGEQERWQRPLCERCKAKERAAGGPSSNGKI